MTAPKKPQPRRVPVQVVLGQGASLGAGAVNIRAMLCGGIDPSDLARRLSDPGASMEWRSEKLLELRRSPDALRMYADLPGRAQGAERIIQVAPDVLRSYVAAPARMAGLGQWLDSKGVALDCAAIADELSGLVFRRHRRSFNPAWAEGWAAWIRWMTRSTEDASGEAPPAPPSGEGP